MKICNKKDMRFRGFLSLPMPENDIIDKTATPKDKAAELIAKATAARAGRSNTRTRRRAKSGTSSGNNARPQDTAIGQARPQIQIKRYEEKRRGNKSNSLLPRRLCRKRGQAAIYDKRARQRDAPLFFAPFSPPATTAADIPFIPPRYVQRHAPRPCRG